MLPYNTTLNKGEWAEFYVLLKLLGQGKLYLADKYLQKKMNKFLMVLSIIREENNSNIIEYELYKTTVIIKNQNTNEVLAVIPSYLFDKAADQLFTDIKASKNTTMEAPKNICDFASIIYVDHPKAKAVQKYKKQFGGKNDILIFVHDQVTSLETLMGFSIKSMFGGMPTLYNAGTSSQILFALKGCNKRKMSQFNTFTNAKGHRDWKRCYEFMTQQNITYKYKGPQYSTFEQNLYLIRESMAQILGVYMQDRLITNPQLPHGVKETTERIIKLNPLKIINAKEYYTKCIKDFLMASFTGMTASLPWDGKEQVTGGYIVVKNDGDIVCYHSIDRESFREYLYNNTFIDIVSSKKFKWSYIFNEGRKYYLPLNISIRFFKETR